MHHTYIHVHNVRIERIHGLYLPLFSTKVSLYCRSLESVLWGLKMVFPGQIRKIRKVVTGGIRGGVPGFREQTQATEYNLIL